MNSNSFHKISEYYDLLYQEKDYAKESKYVIENLNYYNADAIELLELGFGTGNYSLHLINAGYTITGIEKNPEMVTLAKSKSIKNFTPFVDDIRSFNLNRTFHAAFSLFHVISYLTENENVLSCFRQVAKHLKKNGLFIFDVWYTPAVYSQLPQNKIKQVSNDVYDITRTAKPEIFYEQNVVKVNYDVEIKQKTSQHTEVFNETHFMRHFSSPEIKLLAELSGFKVVKGEELLTSKTPDASTWGVCYILQKV